jgi:hypothetical protein
VSGADLLAASGPLPSVCGNNEAKGWRFAALRRRKTQQMGFYTDAFSASTVSIGPWMSRSQRRVWTLADRSPKEHNARRLPREGQSACVPDRSALLVVAVTAVGFAT